MNAEGSSQEKFQRLKALCVPLLGSSRLTPGPSLATVSRLLTDLHHVLQDLDSKDLTVSLISYVFYPISTILQRNPPGEIPDQILEKLLVVLGILCESWWWDFDLKIWEQVFMLCGAIIGGIEGKGKERGRDDETKQAAALCLLTILRPRSATESSSRLLPLNHEQLRLNEILEHARSSTFVPIIGKTLDSLLGTVASPNLALQKISLELLYLIIQVYSPEYLIPSILPGVMSVLTNVCLGLSGAKTWVNGDIVAGSLKVMGAGVVIAIGDDVCIREGAIRNIEDLEGFTVALDDQRVNSPHQKPFATLRTPSWLRATASQLHIAINALGPLVLHPTPSALHSLSQFSYKVLGDTSLTLPQSRALLLSFLLSLSNSPFASVSSQSTQALLKLLAKDSRAQNSLLQTLMQSTGETLSSLPRLLSARADSKVEHAAGLIEAVCRLASSEKSAPGLSTISKGIARLLGPSGTIEKWGWNLLYVLEFVKPAVTLTTTSAAQLTFESDSDSSEWVHFPEFILKNVNSHETRHSLERMFRSLGYAAGDSCLFSVEWFISVGRANNSSSSVAAMWCACRLLEGVSGVALSAGITGPPVRVSKRTEKLSRSVVKAVFEIWDRTGNQNNEEKERKREDENTLADIQHLRGIEPLHETLRIAQPSPAKLKSTQLQPILHRAISLQLIAITSGITQARFTSSLLYSLYPVLHSLVSPVSFLSSTALATLHFISVATSYASPANLLLSNFDYALDTISRRLTRQWLDVDATKVLTVMIRLVGSDIVDRAGDVVEECFDRLDEFHGYEVIVEGLVEVLNEVIKVVEMDHSTPEAEPNKSTPGPTETRPTIAEFVNWFQLRHNQKTTVDETDYGPAPQKAWGEETQTTENNNNNQQYTAPDVDPPPTPIQALTGKIINRSMYFLTHSSPIIRARILSLISMSVSVLPESALLPSVHLVWPFVLSRLGDTETFVVSAAAFLVESLSRHVGSFMFRKIWDDVWPRFQLTLGKLENADASNALARRTHGSVGTESAYTHSHRLYRSIIRTMTTALIGVHPHEASAWQVLVAFRRFLSSQVHIELQECARELYVAAGKSNADGVWLVLTTTSEKAFTVMNFMHESRWDINKNKELILRALASR